MSGFEKRLKQDLEPLLERPDPRPGLSVYHNMPYALFHYEPAEEFELRRQLTLLETRLSQRGKRVTRVSLAECLAEAMRSQCSMEEWFAAERAQGTAAVVDTVNAVLAEYKPLVELVAERMPPDSDPLRDVVFIVRTGCSFSYVSDVFAPRTDAGAREGPDVSLLSGPPGRSRRPVLHGCAGGRT